MAVLACFTCRTRRMNRTFGACCRREDVPNTKLHRRNIAKENKLLYTAATDKKEDLRALVPVSDRPTEKRADIQRTRVLRRRRGVGH